MENNMVLSLKNITKIYPGVVALDDVSVDFRQGEIHALLGENGAGKSTLIKTISGAIAPDMGTIGFGDGHTYTSMTPFTARRHGVEVIYQEFNLVESLSIAENIYLGEKAGWQHDGKKLERRAKNLFDEWHIDLDPSAEVESLSPAKKQLVEICKSISRDVKILIMDEPTAPLSAAEVEIMFRIVEGLKKKGVTIIYISHRMEEIFRITDRVTIMRDGRYVQTVDTAATNRQELVRFMVGRELKESYPVRKHPCGDVVLEVRELCGNGDNNITFSVRSGEIFGLAGLVGSGRTEIVNVIFGAVPKESGSVLVNGNEVDFRSPSDAIRQGIGLIPEDRKFLGCLQEMSIRFNVSLAALKQCCKGGVIDDKKEFELVSQYKDVLHIKTPSLMQDVKNLSGGNQQKVVLAKSLAVNPQILIFDEPTRGIDVGAKQEIYRLMNELADQGKAIIMVSSDLEELLGMSDRIGVLYEGTYAGELEKQEFDSKVVIGLASGMKREELVCKI